MQNIQTTDTQPTLAELIAARAADIADELREQEARERERIDSWIADQTRDIEGVIQRLSPTMHAALEPITVEWLDNAVNGDGLYTLTGTHTEAAFTVNGERWAFDTTNGLYLRGPNGYRTSLYSAESDNEILDTFAQAYPAWLAKQRETEEARAAYDAEEKQREAAAAEEPEQPIHYTRIEGEIPRTCLLHRGAYVTVWYAPYDPREQGAAWGTVEAWDERWLLLTDDKGKQQLINWRHVSAIVPREKDDEQPAPEPTRYDDDMTSNNIPF
jgi:hypothetical protein